VSNQDAAIATAPRALSPPAVRADLLGLLGSELDPTHRLWRPARGWRPADRNLEEEA
jgi:hypothetical protein